MEFYTTHTKLNSFKVLYGSDPPHVMKIGAGQTPVNGINEMLQKRDAMLDEIHFNLVKSQPPMKAATDSKRREKSFEVDDLVYLKLQSYCQKSLARNPLRN